MDLHTDLQYFNRRYNETDSLLTTIYGHDQFVPDIIIILIDECRCSRIAYVQNAAIIDI